MNPELPEQYLARLRASVVLHPQTDEDHAVLEEVGSGRYFRIGPCEENFLRRLLEGQSLESAIQDSELSEQQTQELAGWLNSIGLLPSTRPDPQPSADAPSVTQEDSAAFSSNDHLASESLEEAPGTSSNSGSQPQNAGPDTSTRILSNLFFLKIPLLNPDGFLSWLVAQIGWLFSWQSAVAAGMFLGVAGLATFGSWQEFLSSYEDLMAPGRWLTLGIGWLLLKFVHEIGHAATCKRYGGEVPKAGVALILFMPIAFVDVTSSWRFNSRWKRIHVALGGVLAEAYVAGIALFLWQYTDSILLKQATADIALLATVSSALFNLNPLLKFDGYFVLADITGRHNLYQNGQKYARYFGARYLLGLASEKQAHGLDQEPTWFKAYALSAACWRTLTLVGLMTAASIMLEGAGILLAIAGFFTFVFAPAKALLRFLVKQADEENLAVAPLFLRVGLIATCLIVAAFVTPAEFQQATPGIVEYDPPSILRAPTDGFIDKVHAVNGQFVEEGQPLFELRNDSLKVEWFRLIKEHKLREQAVRSARWQNDTAKLSEALADLEGITTKIKELHSSVEDLTVRAPVSGRLVARGLENAQGKFVERGEEIGAVGSESKKRLKLSMSQWEASKAETLVDERVVVSVLGHWSWREIISSVESRASEIPPDPSLTVPSGGVLAVLVNDSEDPVLCNPRVNAYITLDQSRSQQLRCGQRCWVSLPIWKKSLGHKAIEYLQNKLPSGLELGLIGKQ